LADIAHEQLAYKHDAPHAAQDRSDDGRVASNSESTPRDDVETLAFCARLDQSDTDNGLRFP